MDCSLPGFSIHGVLQARNTGVEGRKEGNAFSSPRDFPDPGIEPRSPASKADSLQSDLPGSPIISAAAAVAKSLQLCLTLCGPTDGSLPASSVHGIIQARAPEWVAIAFSK